MTDQAMLFELGARTIRALKLENEGKSRWRQMEISLRWYDQFAPSRSR